MDRVLVCVPVYNEEELLGEVLDRLHKITKDKGYDIIVINDGSLDNTELVCKEKGVEVITLLYNMGYCTALYTAYKYGVRNNYDYIIQFDGDGQHNAEYIVDIYSELCSEGSPDIVIGSRFLNNNVDLSVSKLRRLGIRFYSGLVKFLTGKNIKDVTSGLQGINRKVMCCYATMDELASPYIDANVLVTMLLRGYKIKEIEVKMNAREGGKSMHEGVINVLVYILSVTLGVFISYFREKFKGE